MGPWWRFFVYRGPLLGLIVLEFSGTTIDVTALDIFVQIGENLPGRTPIVV